jgi:hypothetical protein
MLRRFYLLEVSFVGEKASFMVTLEQAAYVTVRRADAIDSSVVPTALGTTTLSGGHFDGAANIFARHLAKQLDSD